jgi:chromosome segregation ATPase
MHKVNLLESDVSSKEEDKIVLEAKLIEAIQETTSVKESEFKVLSELEDTSMKLKFKDSMLKERDRDLKSCQSEFKGLNEKFQALEVDLDKKQVEIRNYEVSLSEIREDNRKLRSTLIVRSETNSILRYLSIYISIYLSLIILKAFFNHFYYY